MRSEQPDISRRKEEPEQDRVWQEPRTEETRPVEASVEETGPGGEDNGPGQNTGTSLNQPGLNGARNAAGLPSQSGAAGQQDPEHARVEDSSMFRRPGPDTSGEAGRQQATARTGSAIPFSRTEDAPRSSMPEMGPEPEPGPGQEQSTPSPPRQTSSVTARPEGLPSAGPAPITTDAQRTTTGPAKPMGLMDLASSEEVLSEVDSGDDGRFVLTTHRLIYQARSSEGTLFSTAAVQDVTSIQFGRRPRDVRSAWWGVIGLLAAILVWQVTISQAVGNVAGAIVAGISALLLADYWFRPGGLMLRFSTPGGTVEGPVSGKQTKAAEELAARVQHLKQDGKRGTHAGPARPPGGSPGLG